MSAVTSFAELCDWRDAVRGQRLVLGTGCFDILHVGHLYFLEEARQQGDLLVVGVNSDRSVRTLKGEARPIVSEDERATLISAVRCVDRVFVYDDLSAEDQIRALRPNVYVTGEEAVAGYPGELIAAQEIGAQVHVISRLADHSTTSMVTRARG